MKATTLMGLLPEKYYNVCVALFFFLTFSVVPVHDGRGEESPVSVGGVGDLDGGGEVVHVVHLAAVALSVPANHDQVHHKRGPENEEQGKCIKKISYKEDMQYLMQKKKHLKGKVYPLEESKMLQKAH